MEISTINMEDFQTSGTFNSESYVFTEGDSFQFEMVPRWSMWILFQRKSIFPKIGTRVHENKLFFING